MLAIAVGLLIVVLPAGGVGPEELARGKQLFLGHCAPCHGPAGDGGRGANLARPQLPRAPDDKALFDLIRDGIEGSEMPPAWQMVDREISLVAAYVRTLAPTGSGPLPGDPARGEQLYRTRGNCAQCHLLNGQGSGIGPDLSDAGARRSPAYLRRALVEPAADVPEGFLMVTAVMKDGRRIEAARASEDSFSVQIQDVSGRFYSFWKSELANLRREPGKSPMPSYRAVFSDGELDDLVAYLASLRGAAR